MSDFDPANRELCPDGACIGIVGSDGRCRECGRVAPSAVSDPRNQGLKSTEGSTAPPRAFDEERELCPDGTCVGVIGTDDHCRECGKPRPDGIRPPAATEQGSKDGPEDDGQTSPPSPAEDDDFDSRQLCPDGGCVGLLGADSRCKECGKSGSSASP